jgi:hypothetical protein
MRLTHEIWQLEVRKKEKENEFRMIILKIKELKRVFQSGYIQKISGSDNWTKSKKWHGSRSDRGDSPSSMKEIKNHYKKSLPSEWSLNRSEID